MKKLLLFNLIAIFCLGCAHNEMFFVVKSFESIENNLCKYIIKQGDAPGESIVVIDSCDRYKVGDTLLLYKFDK